MYTDLQKSFPLSPTFEPDSSVIDTSNEESFLENETEAALFVDANNAFNSLNRQGTLLNAQSICPSLAPVLINTYRESSLLFVDGEFILSKEGTTQGDPLAMAMCAIGTFPLIKSMQSLSQQVWYADDSAAGSSIQKLRNWWDKLQQEGPKYGYFVNSTKTKLLVKDQFLHIAHEFFDDTGISIVSDGATYLGGGIGTLTFIEENIRKKVLTWEEELRQLTKIAETQPHSAYAALTHGIQSKWEYLLRNTDWNAATSADLLQPIETILQSQLIPTLTGQVQPGDIVRSLLSLPARLGGLGIPNLVSAAKDTHQTSKLITDPLKECITENKAYTQSVPTEQKNIKSMLRSKKRKALEEHADTLKKDLSSTQLRCLDLAQEKGASTWLTTLPLTAHDFTLHKSAFKDALALRYGWPLKNTPSQCICGHQFSIDHVLSCPTGGFPSLRHNEIRDLTADFLTEVCHGVTTEPHLQALNGEQMFHRSANTTDNARLDITMFGFWGGRFEKAFIDVRVFNPGAQLNHTTSLKATYRRHELEKKRQYEERIQEVEHSSFAPLVMSCTGGMGNIASAFYKRLAAMISEKKDIPYSQMVYLIRCKVSFALLRSSIMCIRGSRSRCGHSSAEPYALQIAEGRI